MDISFWFFHHLKLQLRESGQSGVDGQHAPQLVGLVTELAPEGTQRAGLALAVTQILKAAKVRYICFLDTLKVFLYSINVVSVEGSWESWVSWSACSDTCGVGTRDRSRVHNAGLPCTGSPTDTENCQSNVLLANLISYSVVNVMYCF